MRIVGLKGSTEKLALGVTRELQMIEQTVASVRADSREQKEDGRSPRWKVGERISESVATRTANSFTLFTARRI